MRWLPTSPGRTAVPEADAIVTAKPGLAIGILTADCAPVLFCDGEARVIGAAHAGWRGALSGIVEATVKAMSKLGARPERHRRGDRAHHLAEGLRGRRGLRGAVSRRRAGKLRLFHHRRGLGRAAFRPRRAMSASAWRGPAWAPSPISGFAPIATKPGCSAIAGRNIMAKTITGAKFPPSCSPDSPLNMTRIWPKSGPRYNWTPAGPGR